MRGTVLPQEFDDRAPCMGYRGSRARAIARAYLVDGWTEEEIVRRLGERSAYVRAAVQRWQYRWSRPELDRLRIPLPEWTEEDFESLAPYVAPRASPSCCQAYLVLVHGMSPADVARRTESRPSAVVLAARRWNDRLGRIRGGEETVSEEELQEVCPTASEELRAVMVGGHRTPDDPRMYQAVQAAWKRIDCLRDRRMLDRMYRHRMTTGEWDCLALKRRRGSPRVQRVARAILVDDVPPEEAMADAGLHPAAYRPCVADWGRCLFGPE